MLMMGLFHTLMTYMNILSKCLADTELKDAQIQSPVIAEGSMDQALNVVKRCELNATYLLSSNASLLP